MTRSSAPLSNERIQDALLRVILDLEVEVHNVTVDIFSHIPATLNAKQVNEDMVLTIKSRNNSDALAERLK